PRAGTALGARAWLALPPAAMRPAGAMARVAKRAWIAVGARAAPQRHGSRFAAPPAFGPVPELLFPGVVPQRQVSRQPFSPPWLHGLPRPRKAPRPVRPGGGRSRSRAGFRPHAGCRSIGLRR